MTLIRISPSPQKVTCFLEEIYYFILSIGTGNNSYRLIDCKELNRFCNIFAPRRWMHGTTALLLTPTLCMLILRREKKFKAVFFKDKIMIHLSYESEGEFPKCNFILGIVHILFWKGNIYFLINGTIKKIHLFPKKCLHSCNNTLFVSG